MELGAHGEIRLGEGDIGDDLISRPGEGSRVVIGQSCIVQHQIGDSSVSLLVCIVIGNVFGDQVIQLDGAAAGQVHDIESSGHDLSQRGQVVFGTVSHLHIVHLVRVAQIAVVLPVDDGSLVGDYHAAARKGTLVDQIPHEVI